jgi:hypothetical protein
MPPRRLVMTFDGPGKEPPERRSKVMFDIQPHREIVRLHVDLRAAEMAQNDPQ